MEKKRIEWIDLARCIAIFCVILVHSTERVYSFDLEYMSGVAGYVRVFAFSLFSIGRLGVPVLLMISGYLLLPRRYDEEKTKRFWKNNLLGLFLTTEIWIVLWDVFLAWYNDSSFSFVTLIRNMLFVETVNISHYWYMPMILGIYVFLPFAASALQHFSSGMLVFPLLIAASFLFLVPTVSNIVCVLGETSLSAQPDLYFSGGAYGVMMIIGYLFHEGTFDRIRLPHYCILFAGSMVCTVAYQLILYSMDYKYNVWYTNLFLLAASFSLFGILRSIGTVHLYRIVRNIAKYAFGIYLIHSPLMLVLRDHLTLKWCPGRIAVLWVMSFLISWAIAALVNRIPKAGKLIFYVR